MTGERLRKMLHHVRMSDTYKRKVIIASGSGYKYSSNREEIANYLVSLIDRADKILNIVKAIKTSV